MGLTALLSTLLGMLGGLLPDVMKEVRDSRNATRELKHMELQAELQLKVAQVNADSKLREVEGNAFVEEARAFREHLTAIIEAQARPTGVPWIDGWNAALRPACTTLIMILFALTALPFTWVIIAHLWWGVSADTLERINEASKIFAGSLFGEAVTATLAYLWGYRSSAKKAG